MNQFAIELPTFVTASLMLTVSAIVAWATLAWLKPVGHRIYRLVWIAVLINGVMLVRISIDLPVLGSDPPTSIASFLGEPIRMTDGEALQAPSTAVTLSEAAVAGETDTDLVASNGAESPSEVADSGQAEMLTVVMKYISATSIWLTGVVLIIGLIVSNYLRIILMLGQARTAPQSWSRQLWRLCDERGVAQRIPMLVHEQLGPALILTPVGFRVVVPAGLWQQMDGEQQAAILRHEIEHYRRGDVLTSLAATLVASLHWFNPFAWIAVSRLNLAAEWACDAVAVCGPEQRSSYARALLSISTSNPGYLVGAQGMGSSNLKLRIKQLLNGSKHHSRWGGAASLTLIALILLSALVNLRLVTAAATALTNKETVVDDAELQASIQEFAGELSREGELNQAFYRLTQSPAGLIAISNSVGELESEMRNEAAGRVVPEFFASQVDDRFHQQMAKDVVGAKQDIENLKTAIDEIRSGLVGEMDADKLLRRFLNSDNAALVLYFSEMRQQMQPGQKMLMRHLGRFLAKRKDGKFIVRESAKAPLKPRIQRFEQADQQIEILRSELKLLADELVEKDDLHRQLKQRLATGDGAGFVMAMSFDQDGPLAERVDQYLEELEQFFVDAPEGLVINDEARDHLVEAMAEMQQLVARMKRLKEPILAVVQNIDETQGDSEAAVKKFLASESGLAALALRIDVDPTDSKGIGDRIKAEILQQSGAGFVVREDRQDEVSEFSRSLLRANRNLRRQLRTVDRRVAEVPQEKLGDVLASTESKLILVEKIKQHMQQREFDAWPDWVQNHFESINGKYHFRADAKELLDVLNQASSEIQRELENDDF